MERSNQLSERIHNFLEGDGKDITSTLPNPLPGYKAVQINKTKIEVTGEKGQLYTIEMKRSRWACNCTGFKYRSTCKHMQMVPQEVRHAREYLTSLKDQVEVILAKFGQYELCGSYRREKATSKDFDYVIACDKAAFNVLRTELEAVGIKIATGKDGGMSGHLADVPIDIFRSDPESFVTMVLWRTGSKENNIALATAAKAKGMQVLRDGVKMPDGTMIHPKTEQEVFDLVGLPYKKPSER